MAIDYDELYRDIKQPPEKAVAVSPVLSPLPKNLSMEEKCRAIEDEIFSALRRVLNNSDSSDAAVVSAAKDLIDRGWGKSAVVQQANVLSDEDKTDAIEITFVDGVSGEVTS